MSIVTARRKKDAGTRGREEAESKAVGFHKTPIEFTPDTKCRGVIYTAQDRDGRWYGNVALAFVDGCAIPEKVSSLTPARAKKFETEAAAAYEARMEARDWCQTILTAPGDRYPLVDLERVREVRTQLWPAVLVATEADIDEDRERVLDRVRELYDQGHQSEDWSGVADGLLEQAERETLGQDRVDAARRLIEEAELSTGYEVRSATAMTRKEALDLVLCGDCGTTVGKAGGLMRAGKESPKRSGRKMPSGVAGDPAAFAKGLFGKGPDAEEPLTPNPSPRSTGARGEKRAATAVTKAAGETIVALPLDVIHRHPRNRHPTKEAVDALASTIAAAGRQEEPIVVRDCSGLQELPEGHYELLSGETRWLAIRQLQDSNEHGDQWPTIQARIRRGVSDVDALWDVAAGNTGRTDLNPMERAQLLAELVASVESGGAGKTLAEAGSLFGIKEGTVRSTIRLLKLPPGLQSKISNGELPERTARYLIPYVEIPAVMKEVEILLKPGGYAYWLEAGASENNVKRGVQDVVQKHVRPIDRTVKHNYGYQLGYEHARLFGTGKDKTLTEDQRKLLGVQTITIDNKPIEVATNVKAYDALQLPEIQKKLEKRKGFDAGGRGPKGGQVKSEAEKDRQQEERLAKVTKQTAHELLRCCFAETLEENHEIIEPLRTWIEATGQWPRGEWTQDPLPREEFAEVAAIETEQLANPRFVKAIQRDGSESHPTGKRTGKHLDVFGTVDRACRCEGDPEGGAARFRLRLVKMYLWPLTYKIVTDNGDMDENGVLYGVVLLDRTKLPQKIPVLDHAETVKRAAEIAVTIDDAWLAAAMDGQCRLIVARWLKAHTRKQLGRQAKEWGLGFSETAKGSESVGELLEAHRGRGIRLPKCFNSEKKGKRA